MIAAERTLFVVVGHDVLAQFGADGLQPIAEVANDRECSQDRVLPLRQVLHEHSHEQDREHRTDPDQQPSSSVFARVLDIP